MKIIQCRDELIKSTKKDKDEKHARRLPHLDLLHMYLIQWNAPCNRYRVFFWCLFLFHHVSIVGKSFVCSSPLPCPSTFDRLIPTSKSSYKKILALIVLSTNAWVHTCIVASKIILWIKFQKNSAFILQISYNKKNNV